MRLRRYEKYVAALVLLSFISGVMFTISFLISSTSPKQATDDEDDAVVFVKRLQQKPSLSGKPEAAHQESYQQGVEAYPAKLGAVERYVVHITTDEHRERWPTPDYDVHAFYYIWYGNPAHDGKYLHWNHPYLPHWDQHVAKKWPKGRHQPPNDIGSSYYPELGLYSSADISVITEHMRQLRVAGIGVISVSWYPPGQADEQGEPSDYLIPRILDAANKYSIKVCLHIEPYKGRNASSLSTNLKYIFDNYGNHAAFYRRSYKGKNLPMFYIYDSYNVPREEWARIFKADGDLSIRNTKLDGIYIGLLVHQIHQQELISAGFDGYYTYFASEGFTYGSKSQNWRKLGHEAAANDVLFIPSIGPGYIDERIRPWNKINTKPRNNGSYYEYRFKLAVEFGPQIVSITSFNEWHEGTQIEKAVPWKTEQHHYLDYLPNHSDFYLLLTRKWIHKFKRHKG